MVKELHILYSMSKELATAASVPQHRPSFCETVVSKSSQLECEGGAVHSIA